MAGANDGIKGYYIKNILENKGKPRLWFEGHILRQSGFQPGQSIEMEINGRSLIIKAHANGSRTVTGKENKKKNTVEPVIDVNSDRWLGIFDGMEAVRVVVREHDIVIVPLATELKRVERETRLLSKLQGGESLGIGSMYHGGGIMSHAIHKGLKNTGIDSHMTFVNENRQDMVDHAAEHNSAWNENTMVFNAGSDQVAFDDRALAHVPATEVMEMGIPCNAASLAGRAKTGISMPEANEEVGHLVVATIIILNRSNPALATFENVPSYANTASAAILRTQMKALGYNVNERVLNGNEMGGLENRNRWVMIAVSKGLEFDMDSLMAIVSKPVSLGEVLEEIPDNDPRWSKMEGLKEKEIRDKAAGKGFMMQICDENSSQVGTIGKGYAKNRSTEPKIRHPNNPDLLRQLTVKEHGAVKGIPPELLENTTVTFGHEVAGQSVVYPMMEAVGTHIGNQMKSMASTGAVKTASALAGKTKPELPVDIREMAENLGVEVVMPKSSSVYQGRIVGIGEQYFLQDAGRNICVMHPGSDQLIEYGINLGTEVKIQVSNENKISIEVVERKQMTLEV